MSANRPTFTRLVSLRRAGRLTLVAVAVAAPLVAAAPALAEPKNPKVIVNSTFGVAQRTSGPVVVHRPNHGRSSREYERGAFAGRTDGYNNGFRDGLNANGFSDSVCYDFCHASRPFETAYREAYSCAYREGFKQGKCERQRRECERLERERRERERWERERRRERDHCDRRNDCDDRWNINIWWRW